MLLFSNLKKFILRGNIYFNHTNNIITDSSQPRNLPNYVLYLPDQIEYHKNGKYREGDLPTEIHYYDNGQLKFELWYKNGNYHREGDLSAIIQMMDNLKKKDGI